jgi:hypothetical protein
MKSLSSQPSSTEAAQVYRYILKAEDTILLATDIQEWPFAVMESACRETFLRNSRIIVKASRTMHVPVMVSERFPGRYGPTIGEMAELLGDAPRITKLSRSCWREGQIRAGIKAMDRGTVLIIGMEAHLCVLQTVMDLLQTGYNPVVVADAVCSRVPYHAEIALNAMAQAGAVVYPAETVVCMLLERADPGIFEDIMSLSYGDIPPLPLTPEAVNG